MTEPVLVEVHKGYRVVQINRPDRLNALDRATHVVLMQKLLEAEADESCRALILTGTGRGFCAGADLAGRNQPPEPEPEGAPKRDSGSSIEETWNPLARKLAVMRMPAAPSRWAATSPSLPAAPISCRPSPASAWCRIAAAPGSCPTSSAPPAPAAWSCWRSRCRRRKPPNGA